jgi:hypothetical protein
VLGREPELDSNEEASQAEEVLEHEPELVSLEETGPQRKCWSVNQSWLGNEEAGHPKEVLGREPELVR